MLAKKDGTNEGAFKIIFRGFYVINFCQKSKIESWVEEVTMPHIYVDRKCLLFVVKFIQALIFSISRYFIFFLIDRIMHCE